MALPLEGIKVIDLSRMAPGPFCTMVMADLGADVLKVEEFTLTGRRAQVKGAKEGAKWLSQTEKDAAYDSIGRNKRSIGLNLKNDAGREVLFKLAKESDVLVEEFRPGVVKRLGVDYPTIKKINPQIIYLSVTGYGQTGPYKNLVGHDLNYISTAGAQGSIGSPNGDHAIPQNLVADYAGGGMAAAVAVLAALVGRATTGQGKYVDVAMADGVVYLMARMFEKYFKTGVTPSIGKGSLDGGDPRYSIYKTKDDKFISICSVEPWFYQGLCKAMGLQHISDYYQWGMEDGLVREELGKTFLTRTRDEWFDILSKVDACVGKVYPLDEVEQDSQIKARDMIIQMEHDSLGTIKQVGIPFKYLGESLKPRSFAPLNGQNTQEVLEHLGYAPDAIESLRLDGAVN